MKTRNLFIAIFISVAVFFIITMLVFFKTIPVNHEEEIIVAPRRYLDLNQESINKSFQPDFLLYELILHKSLYILIVIHTVWLIWFLKIKNILFYIFYIPSLFIGMFAMVISDLFRQHFVTGSNPVFSFFIAFFVVFQIISWVYFNILVLRRIAAMKTER